MKNFKEKKLLIKWAQAMGEPVDAGLLEEVQRYNQLQNEIQESVRKNSINDLAEASKVAEDFVNKVITYPKPPTLDEVLTVLREEVDDLVQAQEITTQAKPKLASLADRAAELITKEVKLEEKANSFQQPDPTLVEKNFNAVQKKLKFLEQAISKIAAHGPGGGDANPFDRVEFMERGVRFEPTPRMMYWNNTEDVLNISQADGSTLQVGLENYIRVYNNTANTFANGTHIEFIGVDAEGDAPTFRAFVNNANAQPLYSVGVLTTDVLSNTHGRATVLGLVRDIDTTGNAVGEVWTAGDILWANPAYPGKLTKFKPTSPNVTLAVAATVVIDQTKGAILVRPTIWPRLRYGGFFSEQTQVAPSPNEDVKLLVSNALITSGFILSNNSIVALESGLYKFQIRVQLTSSSASAKSIILWYKKNGVNLERSSIRQSVSDINGYASLTNFQLVSLAALDNVSVHFSVTDTNLTIATPPLFGNSASIGSVEIVITEAAL